MIKKFLSSAFVILCFLTGFSQTRQPENNAAGSAGDGSTPKQTSLIRPLVIVQGVFTKFDGDADGNFGAAVSLGIKYMNKYGMAVNFQPMGLAEGEIYSLPVNMELSFTAEKRALRPFANLQIGHVFSGSKYSYLNGNTKINSRSVGTGFFSPGIGLLVPTKKQSGILLTLSYVNSGYKTELEVLNPGGTVNVVSKNHFSGYRIGAGFRF